MNVLGVIPARGGSKGLPGKNLAPCAGRPLIQWTIEAAKESRKINYLLVSSENHTILQAAAKFGAHTTARPASLARDDTPMVEVVAHALRHPGRYDACILLQPTSPLRRTEDIDAALELLETCNSVVSVYESDAVPFTGEDAPLRQMRRPTLYLNGAIYAFRVGWFKEHRCFMDKATAPLLMPPERSVDIDYPLDLALANLLISQQR